MPFLYAQIFVAVMRSKHITAINEAIKQRQSTPQNIKYFSIGFDIESINKDTKYLHVSVETLFKQHCCFI